VRFKFLADDGFKADITYDADGFVLDLSRDREPPRPASRAVARPSRWTWACPAPG